MTSLKQRFTAEGSWLWPSVALALVLLLVALSLALNEGAQLAALVILGITVLGYLFLLLIYRDEDATVWELIASLLASPRTVVRTNLTQDEQLLLMTNPSWAAFFLEHLELLAATAVVGAVGLWMLYVRASWLAMTFYIFFASCYGVFFFYRRLDQWYTVYVFTDDRALVLTGVFNRNSRSVQWRQVTNESWDQPFVGRIFGYATLRLNSASEKAGPIEMISIPGRFKINQLVNERLEHARG